ncbi:hypothetical protein AVEN_133567-1 [Araneus ventricosus]|uniref:Uncharacterized protein n=1 Tax=Araneus ventricosus TaxID=182803 RepID=A0A4Y2I945_ARAVE|nr:hypothetical protein AVEN_133567-1 [Araneus ventricosus]
MGFIQTAKLGMEQIPSSKISFFERIGERSCDPDRYRLKVALPSTHLKFYGEFLRGIQRQVGSLTKNSLEKEILPAAVARNSAYSSSPLVTFSRHAPIRGRRLVSLNYRPSASFDGRKEIIKI